MNSPESFLWHDYETFGTRPAADRPVQFAALRTDAALQPVGEPMICYCAPAEDVLPHPAACLVTGITPQDAREKGVCEAVFARRIHDEMREPGTCIAGFNNLRFDDHVTRHLFYRNFYDPYAHEYADGNSRFDLIDLTRMCYALRPDGVQWPRHESGQPSFRLEDLTAANGIEHSGAHDALADVRATLALARLLNQQQPRLWDWALGLRDQRRAADLLDPRRGEPLLHTSARIPAERGCTSLFLVLSQHPRIRKSVIAFDLMGDAGDLLDLEAEELKDRVFTPRADLPEDVERVPLKAIKTNAVPMIAPAAVLRGVDCDRICLDPARCQTQAERIRPQIEAIRGKIMDVFALPPDEGGTDPDLQLYGGGFFSRADQRLMAQIRAMDPESLGREHWRFEDPRLPEMLYRYRARNYPDSLSADEAKAWDEQRLARLRQPADDRVLSAAGFFAALDEARRERPDDGRAQAILDRLEFWALNLGLEPQAGG